MKKFLLITLVTGEQHEFDLKPLIELVIQKEGIGFFSQPPEHPQYKLFARDIATHGFPEQVATPRRHPRWICPSQIKHIDVVFDTTMFPKS